MAARQDNAPSAEPFIPERPTLPKLHEAVQACTGCDLYKNATQGVMGEGTREAALMIVGEQPGDQEDKAGHPFVGPAGRMLDKALEEVGIDREQVFVTNVVKHFKWTQRGKRRLHVKPSAREIRACQPWLRTEIQLVHPKGIVALGATAAQAFMGRHFRVTQQRGEVLPTEYDAWLLATLHPSALLRVPDDDARRRAYDEFVSDLKTAAAHLA